MDEIIKLIGGGPECAGCEQESRYLYHGQYLCHKCLHRIIRISEAKE